MFIRWGYAGTGDLYCFDTIGFVDWDKILPDSPPFVNIRGSSCVCLEPRYPCLAEMYIDADVTGPVTPGYYRLATFVFSRRGYYQCGGVQYWPQAVFRLDTGGPNTTMTLNEVFTSVDRGSWGETKARYR